MRFRKLRIAWSVVWGLAAVLLIVLWLRSYWWFDVIERVSSGSFAELRLNSGTVHFSYESPPPLPPPLGQDLAWELTSYPASPGLHPTLAAESSIRFPHWCAVMLTGLLATVPWLRQMHWR